MSVFSRLYNILQNFLKKSTIINIILVTLVTIFVKGAGFTKEIIIADKLGLSELLDTYYIAILIPGFLSNLFLVGFNSVFIPNYVSELEVNPKIGSFQCTYFIVSLSVSFIFCLFAFLITDAYLEVFFSGHTQQYYDLIKSQFYYVLPCIILWSLTSLINSLLNVDDEFIFSSLSTIFIPISIILCLVFFKEELKEIVLAFGTLVGSIISFVFVLVIALRRNIILIDSPDFRSKNIKQFFRQIPAKISASLITGMNSIVDQFFAAQLIIGSIAALNYGVKITMFAIGLLTVPLSNVLLPYFSKKVINNEYSTYIDLKKTLKIIILGSSIISIVLIFFSYQIISLIFERNEFTSDDTKLVSIIQQMYLIQVPAYVSGIIMVKFLESINRNVILLRVSIIGLLLNIFLNFILIKKMGVYGLALATSIVSSLNTLLFWIYIKALYKSSKS